MRGILRYRSNEISKLMKTIDIIVSDKLMIFLISPALAAGPGIV